jgi:pyocin large subunit-like protein
MAGLKTALSLALSVSVAALLAACDNGPSAVASKQAAGTQMASTASTAAPATTAEAPKADHRDDPVKLVDGTPMWSPSRRYSAEEGAQRTFDRNGETFGARNVDQFVRKAHAFVSHPPAGTQTIARTNGDTLFYDPKGNVFAVANKAGAPKTMFKPDAGAAYWQEQKDREAKRQTARRSRTSDDEA